MGTAKALRRQQELAKQGILPPPAPPNAKPKIYHACTFYNEVELLKLQLYELRDVVDVFVVGEGNFDWSGRPKPLLASKMIDYLQEIANGKLVHLPIDLSHLQRLKETQQGCRQAEIDSRNAIYSWLSSRIGPADTIWCADIDNIPKPETLLGFAESSLEIATVTCERVCKYALNITEKKKGNCRDNIVKGGFLLKHGRLHDVRWVGNNSLYEDGQWTFSYIAPPKDMEDKLRVFGYYEQDNKAFDVNVWKKVVRNSIDRNPEMLSYCNVLPMDNSFPKHVQKHIYYYKQIGWWYEPSEAGSTPTTI